MTNREPVIRGCELKFRCKNTWAGLEVPPNYPKGVKYCSTCLRDIFLVENDLDLKRAVLKNHCVAIPLRMQISVIEEGSLKKLKEGHLVGHVGFKNLPKHSLKGIWP